MRRKEVDDERALSFPRPTDAWTGIGSLLSLTLWQLIHYKHDSTRLLFSHIKEVRASYHNAILFMQFVFWSGDKVVNVAVEDQ